MKVYKAVLILLFLFISCSGGGGNDGPGGGNPPGNQPPPQGNEFFTASVVFGELSIDYNATNGEAGIGLTSISIFTFDQEGNSFVMSFVRPESIPSEVPLGLGPLDPIGGAIISLEGDVYFYQSGTVIITFLSNERIEGEFDFTAEAVAGGIIVQVIGSFALSG